ncbi:hypothetical protein yberc0001_9670 [Yersinia bercovieri ATCC 43970]|uniref:Uncharacterized protein n=1 Tax=Yersinia bercovieri ATCC 43970 TaxID=349968 RepID=A0ABM9Y3M1_YERBE|nr:hypothetical protein yberc0001_9670 [Yersinia bercovieri ATCC 43970]
MLFRIFIQLRRNIFHRSRLWVLLDLPCHHNKNAVLPIKKAATEGC